MSHDVDAEKERCRAMGLANRGKTASAETKEKMSATRKGRPHSKKHSEAIGKALKGRVITDEWREKLRQAALGRKMSEETKAKMSAAHSGEKNGFHGKTHSDETKSSISKWRIESGVCAGENNPGYVDGRAYEPYCPKWTPSLRRRVRAFFKNTCQMCGHVTQPGEPKMAVHHINYRKDACCSNEVNPLFVTLCPGKSGEKNCHVITNHDRERWESHFTQLIKTKFGGKCYFTKEEMKEEDVALWGR